MRKGAILFFLPFLFLSCRKDMPVDAVNEAVQWDTTPYIVNLPEGWHAVPLPSPADNKLTIAGVALGRKIFYDPILSANNTQSCSSCHDQQFSFTDHNTQFSKGIFGDIGHRNAPALFNLAWAEYYNTTGHRFFWDGGATSLERQVIGPITNPIEMASDLKDVITKLQNSAEYPKLFKRAFGTDSITALLLEKALAQFERTLVSANSRYDLYLRGQYVLTQSEANGMTLYFSDSDPNGTGGADCFHCHGSPGTGGTPFFIDFSSPFRNNGLDDDATRKDSGLYMITGNAAHIGLFKTPSLRNLLFTAPYMHDGRFATLADVIDFYNSGTKKSSTVDQQIDKHFIYGGLNLNDNEKADLIAFLKTLTDSSFTNNPAFSKP